MRNLQALEPQSDRSSDGPSSPCGVQPRPEVGLSSSAGIVSPAPAGKRGGGEGAGKVARKATRRKRDMKPEQIAKWIWDRCHADGDCLIWDGAVAQNSGPAVTSPFTGRTAPARRVLMQALGMDIAGKMATTTCGNPLCMERGHLIAWTRKELQQRTGKGLSVNVLRSAKLAEVARRRSYLTMEVVRDIRASGLRATDAAKRWNIPLQTAARVIRHDSWREYAGNPFAGLGG